MQEYLSLLMQRYVQQSLAELLLLVFLLSCLLSVVGVKNCILGMLFQFFNPICAFPSFSHGLWPEQE